jgi:DNA-binding CsgD family transcriptional regulator
VRKRHGRNLPDVAKRREINAARHTRRGKACERAAELARTGLTTAEIALVMKVAARTARSYLQAARDQGLDVEPSPAEPTDGDQTANQRAKGRVPAQFAARDPDTGQGRRRRHSRTIDTAGIGDSVEFPDGRIMVKVAEVNLRENDRRIGGWGPWRPPR